MICQPRRFGSAGLVIFEEEGLLLRRTGPYRDLTLNDINDEFVEVLRKISELNVHFGFISHRSERAGTSETRTVMAVIFELLSIQGARPDFWITETHFPAPNGPEFRHSNDPRRKLTTRMIFKAMECYRVDKSSAVLVSNSMKCIYAAKEANVFGILCSGRRGDQNTNNEIRSETDRIELTEMQSLPSAVERILDCLKQIRPDINDEAYVSAAVGGLLKSDPMDRW